MGCMEGFVIDEINQGGKGYQDFNEVSIRMKLKTARPNASDLFN